MNITRKNFLRLTSAATMTAAIQAAVTACGGGGGGSSSSSSANASTSAGSGSGGGTGTVSNPSSGTGDGSVITPPTTPPASPSKSGYWSNPLTWAAAGVPSGFVPTASDNIYISSAQTVFLDGDCVCGTLTIFGTLRSLDPTSPDSKSISLTTGNINIMGSGALQIGTEAAPFPANLTATITLNGSEASRVRRTVLGTSMGFTNSGEGRSIRVESGGRLSLVGVAPATKRTKLAAHAAAGASSFTVIDNTGWRANDEIVIGTTDFYGVSVPEKLVLASVNTGLNSITTRTAIASKRWGVIQYVTDQPSSVTGESVTGITTNKAWETTSGPLGTPTALDERAFVINLTRNIIVQGANDTAWTSAKFGAHCMFMGNATSIKLDGVQFRRVGQAGALGRYPIHWHMMSYVMSSGMDAVSSGAFIAPVVGNYAKNCSFSESSQRMITIHGTHGVILDSNVGFDITGHAIFLEDGSEQDNVITNNVVMKIRAPTLSNRLQNHDQACSPQPLGVNTTNGSAGIWNTNPRNTFQSNWINDSEGSGMWNSFATKCFGLSTKVSIAPINTPITLLDDNWAIGNKGAGVLTNDIVEDDLGNTTQSRYMASFFSNPVTRVNTFKNSAGGYSNRIDEGQYQKFVCADNAGMDVFGQATIETSVMRNSLVVAESMNNSTSKRVSSYRAAFATYHELLNFKDIIAVGYKRIAGAQDYGTSTYTGGGLFRLWDLYIQGIFSFSENTNLKQIDCDAPFRTLPSFKDGATMFNRNWAIAGAIYDKNGVFGVQGKYWVYDDPFFTYSATAPVDITPGVPSNGKVTTDQYFGISYLKNATDRNLYSFQGAIGVSRQDSNGAEVGNWNIPDGNTSVMLGNMRHFAAHQGGRYKLTFPGIPLGNYCEFEINLQKNISDIFLIGVPFDSSLNPVVYQQGGNGTSIARDGTGRAICSQASTATAVGAGRGRFLTSTGSLANVIADTTGLIYFKDTSQNTIWLKIKVYPIISNTTYTGIINTEYKPALVIITI
ncbi:hypothetical protein DIC66_04575 [Rhodoferax lacus]|uniref:G8 domain-containing protein n=1 Tax=Rhodoferax lacus TaxID=2184758 RepID=A0A3E1RF49_9BURK|nr:G8 domain-containing protein [Rhodoferax lacus]RFO98005.1 hypothetical protein DIC66_04575 [Rhodoferax lacus]